MEALVALEREVLPHALDRARLGDSSQRGGGKRASEALHRLRRRCQGRILHAMVRTRRPKTMGINIQATRDNLLRRIPPELHSAAVAAGFDGSGLFAAMAMLASHGNCAPACRVCGLLHALSTLGEYEVHAPGTATGEAALLHRLIEAARAAASPRRRLLQLQQALQEWVPLLEEKHIAMAPLGPHWDHDHEASCERPRRVASAIAVLLNDLPELGVTLPRAFGPRALRQPAGKKPRSDLVTHLEQLLARVGFEPWEIAEIVDDGNAGVARQRVDRVRKRRARAPRGQ
jgi:hypothetical protein